MTKLACLDRRIVLSAVFVGCISLLVTICALGQEKAVYDAHHLLKEAGIEGLCHPTTDDYAPLFPQCSPCRQDDVVDYNETRNNVTILETTDAAIVAAGAAATDTAETTTDTTTSVSNNDADHQPTEAEDKFFYIRNAVLALTCVVVAALAAGLTMGLLSLDPLVLLIKMRAGATEKEKRQAASLLPLVKQHHRLLVTLLLANSMANEALPLFLDKLVPGYVAVILSVTLVLFFGEIIPSAIFTGPNQLQMASKMAPLVKFVMCLLYPLAWPIAKVLDNILHEEDEGTSSYNRGELSALVRIQYEERMAIKKRRKMEREAARALDKDGSIRLPMSGIDIPTAKDYSMRKTVNAHKMGMSHGNIITTQHEGAQSTQHSGASRTLRESERSLRNSTISNSVSAPPSQQGGHNRLPSIHFDEVNMVEGALQMGTKSALDVYTPLRSVFSIPYDTILDESNAVKIYSSGYSRVPVYDHGDKTAIRGVLMTKQLIVVNSGDERPVHTLPLYIPFCVGPKMNLVDLLNLFQTGGAGHVSKSTTNVKGGHLALVCARPQIAVAALEQEQAIPEMAGLMGIITLEDVLEAILQEQIYDEGDKRELSERRIAEWVFSKWRLFVKRKKLHRREAALDVVHQVGRHQPPSQTLSDVEKGTLLPATDQTPLLQKGGI